jgi:hypothetical protein
VGTACILILAHHVDWLGISGPSRERPHFGHDSRATSARVLFDAWYVAQPQHMLKFVAATGFALVGTSDAR